MTGWRVRVDYAVRISELVGDLCRLTGMPPRTASLLEAIAGSAAAVQLRLPPRLCADGSPVEICERLGRTPVGPAITCELGVSQALASASAIAFPGAHVIRAIDATAGALIRNGKQESMPFWIGVHCDVGGAMRTKLYYSFDGRHQSDATTRCSRALLLAGFPVTTRLQDILRLFEERGYLRMVAFSVDEAGAGGVKVYARIRRADGALVDRLARLSGVPFEPFDCYVRRVLRRARDWFDGRAGLGVGVGTDGTVRSIALYHYAAGYFGNDDALRERLLSVAGEFEWDAYAYRASTRLIDSGSASRARCLLGFGASQTGSEMHAYAQTGYLAA